jgi:hypothetical protein
MSNYRTTAAAMYELRGTLRKRVGAMDIAALDRIDSAIRLEDLAITLVCLDHGPVGSVHPLCAGTDPPHRLQRVAVNHDVLDELERDGDDETRAAIARSRERLA